MKLGDYTLPLEKEKTSFSLFVYKSPNRVDDKIKTWHPPPFSSNAICIWKLLQVAVLPFYDNVISDSSRGTGGYPRWDLWRSDCRRRRLIPVFSPSAKWISARGVEGFLRSDKVTCDVAWIFFTRSAIFGELAGTEFFKFFSNDCVHLFLVDVLK